MTHTIIRRSANIIDESSRRAYETFTCAAFGGGTSEVEIDREHILDVKAVLARLLKYNVDLPTDPTKAARLVQAALEHPPVALKAHAQSTGWRPEYNGFVTSTHVIGAHDEDRELLPPRRINETQRASARPAGTVSDWQRAVANHCRHSSVAMFSLSLAFAPPLLELMSRGSFGINLFGNSKKGKSTMLLVGSSVAGTGNEADLPNCEATIASLKETCRLHNGILMPVNEMGLLNSTSRRVYNAVKTMTYQLAEGVERGRHSGSTQAVTDGSGGYRTIFLLSAEHSAHRYARDAGVDRDGGEVARLTDVPVLRPGQATIVDFWPSHVSEPSDRAKWSKKLLKALRRGCAQNHGVALRPLILHIMQDPRSARRRVDKYTREFLEAVESDRLNDVWQHAADNFALCYAGLRLAIDAGVVDFHRRRALIAIKRCFLSAHDYADGHVDLLTQAKTILRRHLSSLDASDGYEMRGDNGRRQFVIRVPAFRKWFQADPGCVQVLLEWLRQRECLVLPKSYRKQARSGSIDWAITQKMWPIGRSERSIVLQWPRAADAMGT